MQDDLQEYIDNNPKCKALNRIFTRRCDEKPEVLAEEFFLKSGRSVSTLHYCSTTTFERQKLGWRLSVYPKNAAGKIYRVKPLLTRPYCFLEVVLVQSNGDTNQRILSIDDGESPQVRMTINGGEYVVRGLEEVRYRISNHHFGLKKCIDNLLAEIKESIDKQLREASE